MGTYFTAHIWCATCSEHLVRKPGDACPLCTEVAAPTPLRDRPEWLAQLLGDPRPGAAS